MTFYAGCIHSVQYRVVKSVDDECAYSPRDSKVKLHFLLWQPRSKLQTAQQSTKGSTMVDINAVFENAIIAYKGRERPPDVPKSLKFYKVADAFEPAGDYHSYWHNKMWAGRFEESMKSGILYRPSVTDEITMLIQACFEAPGPKGLMIKGPQGIGKSHSIINVYRKLVTSGDYLVTFIPYCQIWNSLDYFVQTVCQSLNLTLHDIGMQKKGVDSQLNMERAIGIVGLVADLLKSHGLKWVFIFDQINSLFARFPNASKLEGLPAPYNLVSGVQTPGVVTCVIAASANNEIAYKESHKDFTEYHHPPCLDEDELPMLVENLMTKDTQPPKQDDAGMDEAENEETVDDDAEDEEAAEENDYIEQSRQTAGGVPLYVRSYLKEPGSFQNAIQEEVHHSLEQLQTRRDWDSILDSIVSSLLLSPSQSDRYDKKYCLREVQGNGKYAYQTLCPAISGVYRFLLWGELMKYLEKKEEHLLSVCGDPSTTNDTRGRIFEHIAIRRMQSNETIVDLDDGVRFSISKDSVTQFPGVDFPTIFPRIGPAKLMIPNNPNFPAVDWIWVDGSTIYGVQCHVNEHDDVFDDFVAQARKAKWFANFGKVELVYFSPEEATTSLVHNRVTPVSTEIPLGRPLRNSPSPQRVSIKRRAIFISSLSSLNDLQWPTGCSVPKPKKMRT